jgi:hypothetical protein
MCWPCWLRILPATSFFTAFWRYVILVVIKNKLKLHLIVYLCSTFRKLSVDFVGSWPAMVARSMLQRMCTTWHQQAWTLVLDHAMLPRQAPLVQHMMEMFLTWTSTWTQWRMFSRSLSMLLTRRRLHSLYRVDEHGSL